MDDEGIASRGRRAWLGLPLAFVVPARSGVQAATTRLSLTTGALPPITSAAGHPGFIEELARAAFGRVGVQVDVTTVPTERSLINVNAGLDDGDIFRVAGVEKEYPNVVRIPEKTLDNEFIAYTTPERTDVRLGGWDDLRPYSVAFATGWKPFERNVRDVKELTKTPSIHDLFPLLLKGRADLILMDRWQGQWVVRQNAYKVRLIEPPLASFEMFMYLNRKHADLVPGVARALADMKADGTYQRIYDRCLKPFDNR